MLFFSWAAASWIGNQPLLSVLDKTSWCWTSLLRASSSPNSKQTSQGIEEALFSSWKAVTRTYWTILNYWIVGTWLEMKGYESLDKSHLFLWPLIFRQHQWYPQAHWRITMTSIVFCLFFFCTPNMQLVYHVGCRAVLFKDVLWVWDTVLVLQETLFNHKLCCLIFIPILIRSFKVSLHAFLVSKQIMTECSLLNLWKWILDPYVAGI